MLQAADLDQSEKRANVRSKIKRKPVSSELRNLPKSLDTDDDLESLDKSSNQRSSRIKRKPVNIASSDPFSGSSADYGDGIGKTKPSKSMSFSSESSISRSSDQNKIEDLLERMMDEMGIPKDDTNTLASDQSNIAETARPGSNSSSRQESKRIPIRQMNKQAKILMLQQHYGKEELNIALNGNSAPIGVGSMERRSDLSSLSLSSKSSGKRDSLGSRKSSLSSLNQLMYSSDSKPDKSPSSNSSLHHSKITNKLSNVFRTGLSKIIPTTSSSTADGYLIQSKPLNPFISAMDQPYRPGAQHNSSFGNMRMPNVGPVASPTTHINPSGIMASKISGACHSVSEHLHQIQGFINRYSPSASTGNLNFPSGTISSPLLTKYLTSLRISLTSQPITWVKEFVKYGGCGLFCDLFELVIWGRVLYDEEGNSISYDSRIALPDIPTTPTLLELCKCLKALINCECAHAHLVSWYGGRLVDLLVWLLCLDDSSETIPNNTFQYSLQVKARSSHGNVGFFVRKLIVDLLIVFCYSQYSYKGVDAYDSDFTSHNDITGHHMIIKSFRKISMNKLPPSNGLIKDTGNSTNTHLGYSPMFASWISQLGYIVDIRSKISGAADGGMVAGVGWVGESKVSERDLVDYLVGSMMLVNGILISGSVESSNSDIPQLSKAEYRHSIRNSLFTVGFSRIVERLSDFAQSSEYLRRQVEMFQNSQDEDWALICAGRTEMMKDAGKCIDDPIWMAKALVRDVDGSPAYSALVKILQNLMLVRADFARFSNDSESKNSSKNIVRARYFTLISRIVEQIVLDGKGIDPDFSTVYYPLQLDKLLGINQESEINELKLNGIDHNVGSGGSYIIEDEDRFDYMKRTIERLQDSVDRLVEEKSMLETQIISAKKQDSSKFNVIEEENIRNLMEKLRLIVNRVREQKLVLGASGAQQIDSEAIQGFSQHKSTINEQNSLPDYFTSRDSQALKSSGVDDKKNAASETLVTSPTGAIPPPPPPPPSIAKIPKVAPIYKSSIKLKPLQWTKIPDHEIAQTCWKEIGEEVLQSKGPLVKLLKKSGLFKNLEREFSVSDFKKTPNKISYPKEGPTLGDTDSMNELNIVDAKKSYNLLILLSRLKMDTSEIMVAIKNMDKNSLSPHLIKQLVAYSPSAHEVGLLSAYADSEVIPANLSKADKFLIELIKIGHFDLRLRYMQFQSGFDERFRDVQDSLDGVDKAVKSIKTNESLKNFLQLVLLIGNVMNNNNGFRGNARGFKLSSLVALADTKSSNSSDNIASSSGRESNFLRFILTFARTELPSSIQFISELEPSIKRATKISLNTISQEFANLHDQLRSLVRDFSKVSSQATGVSDLANQLPSLRRSLNLMDKYALSIENLQKETKDLVEWFGEEVDEGAWEGLVGSISKFLGMCRQTQELIQEEEKSSKKRSSLSKKEVDQAINESIKYESEEFESLNSKGAMDSLLDSLRKGEVPARAPSIVRTKSNHQHSSASKAYYDSIKPLDSKKISSSSNSETIDQLLSQIENF